jgi:hypothetical protein
MFSITLNLFSSRRVTDDISHPYSQIICNIIFVYILISMYLARRPENQMSEYQRSVCFVCVSGSTPNRIRNCEVVEVSKQN